MKERLNELIKLFKERNTVRKIFQAKDVKAVYEEEKVLMKERLESFYQEMQVCIEDGQTPINEPTEVITPENVVEFCFIILMSGVDDDELIENWGKIESILFYVESDLQEIAQKLSKILYEDLERFSDYSEEEILKKLIF